MISTTLATIPLARYVLMIDSSTPRHGSLMMLRPEASRPDQGQRLPFLQTVSLPYDREHAMTAAPTLTAASLVQNYHGLVFRTLRRLGVAEADVDDATQKVFITLVRRLHEITPEQARSFVYGVAMRTAANERRATRTRTRELDGSFDDLADYKVADPNPSADDLLQQKRAVAILDTMLDNLSSDLREVFVLCTLEELTAPEVAELLDIPVGTVASRLRRAREAMTSAIHRFRAQQQSYTEEVQS
jgi:RNA polymerase sigma-70 factor, ECF subfamily